jgi:TonB family protein
MRILLFLLGSLVATADPSAQGTLTRPPELVEFVPAEYPPEAEAAGIQGSVVLSIVIGEDGAVREARVVDPGPDPSFAPAALHAVVQFRFRPAEIDGKPAAVEISYRYDFVLTSRPPAPALEEAPIALEGRVVERGTRSPVAGATVQAGSATAETGTDGRFVLRGVSPGEVQVRVVSTEHVSLTVKEKIEPGKVRVVEYRLSRQHYDPYEAVVRGERSRSEVTVRTLTTEEVRTIPGTQGDTLKVLQSLPGVARSPFGIGLLVVRGSEPNQTIVYVDGVPIPLLFHFGGITSVINGDVVDSVDFYPGNYANRYGRALGGTVELRTREPKRELHGAAQVDLFDGRVEVEGPVGKGSMYAAVRRSWIDAVLAVALPRINPTAANDLRVAPRYYDWQTKLSYPVLGGQGTVFAYGSDDKLEFVRPSDRPGRPSFYLSTSFWRAGVSHRAPLGPATNELTVAAGKNSFDVLNGGNFGLLTDVTNLTLRDRLSYRASPALTLETGVDALANRVSYSVYAPPTQAPGQVNDTFSGSPTTVGDTGASWWLSPAAWVEADWRPIQRLRLVTGLRLDAEERFGVTSLWVDPRASAFVEARPGTTVVAGAGLFGSAPQPQETNEVFGNPDLAAERALHLSLGVRQDLPWSSRLEVTGFYKELRDLVVPTRSLDPGGRSLRYSNAGLGQNVGLELLARRELAQGLFGWLSWTWSRSLRRDDPTDPNFPHWRVFQLDQTHVVALVLSYRLPREWIVGTRVRLVTGNPYTPAVGAILNSDTGRYQCIPGSPLSRRLPPFFQADARVDKRWVFEKWMFSTYLDVQNLTNHENAEFRFRNFDCSQTATIPSIPFFPSLGLRAEW